MIRIANQLRLQALQPFYCSARLSSTAVEYTIRPERVEEISKSPSGWVPRATPPPELPFDIQRSKTNNIPVYVKYSNGRSKVVTSIRKVRGDIKALEHCVRQRLGNENHYQINELTNQLHVKGNHRDKIVLLLKELGF